jgi:hypothetical protein
VRFGDLMIRFAKAAGPRPKEIAPPLLLYVFVNTRTLADRGYPNQRRHHGQRASSSSRSNLSALVRS